MKSCVFVFVWGLLLHGASSMTHFMKIFFTASSQVPNLPEFVAVTMIDDVEVIYYDSITERAVPKQDWMNNVTEEDPQHWDTLSQEHFSSQQMAKVNNEIIKQQLNQTGGVHIFQCIASCEWDDETNRMTGNYQYRKDGEDFLSFDLETLTWIALKPDADIIKPKLDSEEADKVYRKNYLSHVCPERLKKYVGYGRSSLMRKELPSVSLLQKSSSSPVSCHATGFYPDRAMLFWTKDGVEDLENEETGEILPNHDGTFQMSVDLDVSSVKPEDWERYSCVFQLSGVKEDITTKLDRAKIWTNDKRPTTSPNDTEVTLELSPQN